MPVPPVFHVEDLTPDLIDDLRDASATYCDYEYTNAFDALMAMPELRELIYAAGCGVAAPRELANFLRDRLLRRWSSTRSLGGNRMESVGDALDAILPDVVTISEGVTLEDADRQLLTHMMAMFRQLDDCFGVGPTIASKLLAPLRPELFPMWDNPIADAYGFALNAAGYRQYLSIMQAVARKARSFWKGDTSLEAYLRPAGRDWTPPLAKVLDEWNWIRITRGHAVRSAR